MKYLFIFFFAAQFMFAQTGTQLPYSYLYPLPTGTNLRKVVSLTDQKYLAVSNNASILTSTDNGLTWNQKVYPDDCAFMDVSFCDSLNGIVLSKGYGKDFILRTINGATTFDTVYRVMINKIGAIQKLNDSTDFYCAYDTLYKRVNSTIYKYKHTNTNYTPNKVCFLNKDTGFIAFANGILLKTIDGGSTFTVSKNVGPTYGAADVVFIDNSMGFLYSNDGKIYKTIDLGNSWTQVFYGNGGVALAVRQNKKIFALSYLGNVYTSINFGTNWVNESTLNNLSPTAICFSKKGLGFIVGGLGAITKYDSITKIWNKFNQHNRIGTNIGIKFYNHSFGYGIDGLDYNFFKTNDGGDTWSYNQVSVTPLRDVYFVNQNVGFITQGGSGSTYYKTTDGGNNWTPVTVSGATFYRIYFYNQNLGFLYGDYGTVYKTTDGGNTWTNKSFTTSLGLQSMHFINDTLGFMGSNGLVIYKTIDAGNTWIGKTYNSSNSFPLLNDIRSIHFTNLDTGVVIGYASVYKTTDGGANYYGILNSGLSTNQFHFSDLKNGILYGTISNYKENSYRTRDGGLTWKKNYYPFNAVSAFMYDTTTTFICGDNHSIIRIGPKPQPLVTGINGLKKYNENDGITVFPNPAKHKFQIQFQNAPNKSLSYKIINSVGKIVKYGYIHNNDYIDVSPLSNGIYFIETVLGNQKIIITND